MKKVFSEIAVFVLMGAVIIGRYSGSIAELSVGFIGGSEQDGGLYVWLVRTFFSDWLQALRLESNAFYPYGISRAWSDNFLLPSAVFSLFRLTGVTEALSYNLLIIGAAALNGYGTYFLARTLGTTRFAAVASGLIFQNISYFWVNLGHPQLQFAFFLPFAFAFSLRGLKSNSLTWWILAGAAISSAFLTTVYFAVFCSIIIGVVIVGSFFLNDPKTILRNLPVGIVGLAVGAVPMFPFLMGYSEVQLTFDTRHLYETYYFSASALSYVSFSQLSRWYQTTSSWSTPEGQLGGSNLLLAVLLICLLCASRSVRTKSVVKLSWISFVLLNAFTINLIDGPHDRYVAAMGTWLVAFSVLALFSVARRELANTSRLSHSDYLIVLCVAAVFLVLSYGPLGNPTKGEAAASVFVPFYYLVPGVNSLRAVARYGLVVWMCIAVSVPYLLQQFIRNRVGARVIIFAVVLGSAIEGWPTAYPLERMAPKPQIVGELEKVMEPGNAALFLPMADEVSASGVASWGEYARLNTRYMNWNVGTSEKILNGYSGQRSKLMLELPVALRDFPTERSLDRLSAIAGLRFIVILTHDWTTRSSEEIEAAVASFPERLSLLARDNQGNLLIQIKPLKSPPYLIAPAGCSIELGWTKAPSSSTCLPKWAEAKTSSAEDLDDALAKSANRLESLTIIPETAPTNRVRPRIVALSAECIPSLLTTTACSHERH